MKLSNYYLGINFVYSIDKYFLIVHDCKFKYYFRHCKVKNNANYLGKLKYR